jgi:hypothetical protein
MAKKDDWFANERWDDAEQTAFFRRLARAKNKRLFYARAKAGYIARTGAVGIAGAIALLERALTGADDQDLYDSCLFSLARYYVRVGDTDAAIERFRRVLLLEREGKLTRHTQAAAELAFLALRLDRHDLFPELVSHFEWYRRPEAHLPWWADFEFAEQALSARLALATDRRAEARAHAARAIAAVDARFPSERHPSLGNTLADHQDLVAAIRRILD